MEESGEEKAVYSKYLEKMLPKVLVDRLRSDALDSHKKFYIEHSWKESIDGACGLFDISGFSRLAAHLSREEESTLKKRPSNKQVDRSNWTRPTKCSMTTKIW